MERIRWAFGVAALLVVMWFGREWVNVQSSLDQYSEVKKMISDQYVLALLIFFLSYAGSVSLSLPVASTLTLMGAALFGWITFPIVITAATSGALVIFWLASTVANKFFFERASDTLEKVRVAFHQSPIRWLLMMRLVPFFPFWLVNIIPALLKMRQRDYVFATVLGIIPGTAIYVCVGRGLDTMLSQGLRPQWSITENPEVWVPLVLLGIFFAASALISNRHRKEFHEC
jgi:uncharacterized membrane protein YdjX (TVP38/TMEM64 family)